MALVTIVGYPCSGKSRIAEALVEDFRARLADQSYTGPKLEVVHVSDENSHVPRSVYDSELLAPHLIPLSPFSTSIRIAQVLMVDSISEKNGRGNLFTNVTRSLGPERIVINDSLNYIKGFRYQMYCAAREAHSRTVTVSPALSYISES